MHFEVYLTPKKQCRWRLRAENGKIIANAGESYKRMIDCLAAMALVVSVDKATPVQQLTRLAAPSK